MMYPIFADAAPSGSAAENAAQTAAQLQNAATEGQKEQQVQTQQPSSEPVPPPQGSMKDGLLGMLPFIVLIVVMFYLMYRGQKKEQKRRQEMIDSVKKGDHVLTIGGIYGKVAEIHDDRFVLEVTDNVKLTVAKTAVSTIKAPGESLKKADEGAGK